jgi:hypothetical protein
MADVAEHNLRKQDGANRRSNDEENFFHKIIDRPTGAFKKQHGIRPFPSKTANAIVDGHDGRLRVKTQNCKHCL